VTTLVLWDIDLTLVDYSGVGRRWYGEALTSATGLPLKHLPEFPGRTERSLAREFLAAHDVPHSDEQVERFFAALTEIAGRARPSLPTLGRALAGATEILTALATSPNVVQSLVTGNLAPVADYKLAAFDLDQHLDLTIGGYGSLSEHRHDLVAAAITAATTKHAVDFRSVVVIGDTPHDVAAGLHHGTTTVGVATGRHTEAQLRDSGAHVVLQDLSNTPMVLEALLA
jgi:phosphoglycolate phosphatase-like HAD superfamily hydrolase